MTARLGPSSQQGFGPRAGTGWRAARKVGQARRQVNTTGNKSCFGCPAPMGAEFSIRNEYPMRKHKRGLTAKLPWGAGTNKQSVAVRRGLSGQAMFNKEHAWWAVLIKGKRGNPKNKENRVGGGNPRVVAIIYCKECAEVPREWMPKRGKAGQRVPRSVLGSQVRAGQRAWLQPGGCALMGCRCPISDGQGWAKAQPGHVGTRLKGKARTGRILDIMAKESYLLQGTIYSNRQTIVNYYNGTGIGQ